MLAIIQARTSSSRLPGKVLRPLLGAPMLVRQVERLRRAQSLDALVVATSLEAGDDAIEAVCRREGISCHRGSLEDVLGRFVTAIAAAGRPEHCLRLTADCPLIDPAIVDLCVAAHLESGADLTHNQEGWTYPKGLDVEVCRTAALEAAAREAEASYEREHVTPFLYSRPERFNILHLRRDPPAPYRWTVDTVEDFAFVESVYAALYPGNPAFTTEDILAWQALTPSRIRLNTEAGA